MSNPGVTEAVDHATLAQYDMIIDVRSPGEFAEDRIPGAVNLPVLDDAERARVGTIYVQESRFLARRVGAALVAKNIVRHIEGPLADMGPNFRPLVYCWRGGQRSNAMALVLAQVGWRTMVLAGGYKTYRRAVQQRLYAEELGLRFVVLDGGTGTGKTEILNRVGAMGGQVLDLEGLARHRGSLFGALAGTPQPSQKCFESSLMDCLTRMDSARPVLVEAESNKIGKRTLPPGVWRAMVDAPRIMLSAPMEARADYLVQSYPDVIADRGLLEQVLSRLEVYPGRKQLANWRELADAGAFAELVRQVVERHYDPSYRRRASGQPAWQTIAIPSLEAEAQEAAARQIMGMMERALAPVSADRGVV
jgi:tRNA 2-selenouridine synthase